MFTDVQNKSSSAVGWAIRMGKKFSNGGVQEIAQRILPLTRTLLPKVDPRLSTGYATLLYFCEQVKLC